MGIPVNEQETVINFRRGEPLASIFTTDSTMITKLNKCVEANPSEWKRMETHKIYGEIVGYTYECPKKYASSFRKSSTKRTMTEEQKMVQAERMRNLRAK